MESREFIWKETLNDGALPIRRFNDGRGERAHKAMKKAPFSESQILEEGLVKNIKKVVAKDFVDEKTYRKFQDGNTVYCHSLKCYVQVKSFD